MPNTSIKITTSLGEIEAELNADKAPISVENFLAYVKNGTYDGTIFHRVISNFMVQGGGFTPDMKKKPTSEPIANEWKNGLKNVRGSLAMARLGGDPDSATSQFFINAVDNDFLDRPQPDGAAYAVFGMVTKGLDVLDKIRVVKTGSKAGHSDVPLSPVEITKIEVVG
jgi:cyclophilin family peptidyl-prolyl cis-trans isomerase